jgi:uncharacterized protein Yka (UPF0111/DUF47 family)
VTFSLRRVLNQLTGRSHQIFVALLQDQIDTDLRGVDLLREVLDGRHSGDVADKLVIELEHQGDRQRAALVAELSRAITTPIDREDLFRVSRSIDDVLDNLRDFARELHLYQPQSTRRFEAPLDAIALGLNALRSGVAGLADLTPAVSDGAKAAKKAGNKIRRLYERAVAELLQQELSMEVLRQRELLRRLDIVALRLGEAADALADGALKRSQ